MHIPSYVLALFPSSAGVVTQDFLTACDVTQDFLRIKVNIFSYG
jgi:hypothetical protein